MKTRTRIGAMILTLALLCAVPVGAETEKRVVIDSYIQEQLSTLHDDDELAVFIWLPQADWGIGDGLYGRQIVSASNVLTVVSADALYEFLTRERNAEALYETADREWFIKTYHLPADSRLYMHATISTKISISKLRELIAADPDAFIGLGSVGMTPRPFGPKGDADENVKVDSSDARLVLQYAVGKVTNPRFINIYNADFDSNKVIDSADARQILQKAVGKL